MDSDKVDMNEFSLEIDNLIQDLEDNPEIIETLTNEQILKIEKKLNPYGATIYGPEKYTCISFTNLREKYMSKLLTTALVGFTYQMAKEHVVDEDDLNVKLNKEDFTSFKQHPDKTNKQLLDNMYEQECNKYTNKLKEEHGDEYVLTEDDELNVSNQAKEFVDNFFSDQKVFDNDKFQMEQERLVKEQSVNEQKIINKFLNNLFKYDPNQHAKPSFNKSQADSDVERSEVKNEFTENIPPNDTYARFQFYYDVNYDKIRESVQYLYNEKPDVEVAINIYDSFDTVEECNDFIEKNKDNVITNLFNLTNYKWNLLGSFKQNRERINFYNNNTVVLENILKQQESDAKTGKALLNDRVHKKKVKNVKQYGKDHPNFTKYKKQNVDGLLDSTTEKITITDDNVTVEEIIEIADTGAHIDEDGIPEDSLEIKVTSINLSSNEVKTGSIYTKSQAPQGPQ